MMKVTAVALALALGLAFRAGLSAATLYVDGTNGNDAQSGLTLASAWRTIQHAAAVVNPGDTVLIQPGVYFEQVLLTRTGTAVQPITFRATGPGTIVSGANATIRAGQAVWTLESGTPNLYSTPLPAEPATVLSDGVDLFAYVSLAELQSFTFSGTPSVPGPQQGFAFASGKLYVRLNARYGSLLPAAHTMKVSPVRAGGYRGDVIVQPSDYNWSVQTAAPAYVVIDGFTFESPGYAGVWIHYGNVTVRNCRFLGCRTGVRGWAESENLPSATSRDVIVQGCEFSQYPAFQDMIDVVAVAESLTPAEQAAIPAFFWWSRKGGQRTSEIGLTTSAGLRWKILGNYIHDTIDGLSFLAIGWSDQCEVAYNHFERLIDNAIEAEQHSQHLRVHHNFVRDAYEPFSYQPDAGQPYPASTWFYRNVVTLTPETTAFWKKPILRWTPGCIKIKPPTSGFTSIALDGLVFFNNTLHYPVGNVFTTNSAGTSAGPIKYYNNLVIADVLLTTPASPTFAATTFSHNIVAPALPGQPGPGAIFAGTGGQTLASAAQMGFEDFASGRLRLAPGSPALGAGVVVAELPGTSTDVGALPFAPQHQRFDQWRFQYFYDHLFEPEISGATADPDADGVANLLECLFARNPRVPDGAGPATPSLEADGHLVLSFLRRTPLPEDATWKVEASGDLFAWASGAGVTQTLSATPSGPDLTTEHVRDSTALGGTPRFLRLQATLLDIPPGPVPVLDPPPPTGDILIDGFTDGNRVNGADAADAAWFLAYPPDNGTVPTLSIVADNAGLGTGNALFVDNVTYNPALPYQSSSKSIISSFPRETLAAVGDKLTLSFNCRFANIAYNQPANYFRFGLYDSHYTPFTADYQYNAPGHEGCMASVNFGTVGAIPALLKELGYGNINAGDDISTVGSFGAATFSLLASVPKYSLTLTLTKTAAGVAFRLQILNGSGATLLDQTVTDPSPQTTFNELLFSTSQSEADYYLDNVLINFTPGGG